MLRCVFQHNHLIRTVATPTPALPMAIIMDEGLSMSTTQLFQINDSLPDLFYKDFPDLPALGCSRCHGVVPGCLGGPQWRAGHPECRMCVCAPTPPPVQPPPRPLKRRCKSAEGTRRFNESRSNTFSHVSSTPTFILKQISNNLSDM